MPTPSRVAALVALATWLCPRAYAPIYGTYPGLRSLIEQSHVIAAITILDRLSEEDMGGSARYKIQFEKTLKGNPSQKQTVAYLRKLEITTESELLRSRPPQPSPTIHYFGLVERFEPFRPSSRWIAFLATSEEKDAAYENVNCAGSTFPLSPLRDLDALKVEPLPDTLILLFREYVDFKRAN